MKTLRLIAAIICILGFFDGLNAQVVSENSRNIDYEAIAQKLVNQCGHIQEGEIVYISGGFNQIELLESIVVNVKKLGAFPLLNVGSDRLTRRLYTEVPVKYDTQTPELSLKLFDFVTATIILDFIESADLLADIPPERFVAINNSYKLVNELIEKRSIKGVYLGNGLYPTESQAKQFGLSQSELSDIFWRGVNTDYLKLEAIGKAVKTILTGGKEIHIVQANGTDLKVSVENKLVFVSDGSLSAEDLKQGYAASQVYLPAGEVFMAAVPGTAEGKFVVDRDFFQGQEITGLVLSFHQGKLVSMTAKSGLDVFKAYYDAAGPGKEEFAFFDVGINPDVQIKPGSKLLSYMPSGVVTLGIGNNIWAGGENNSPFSYLFFLPGSTVTVDGKVLVDKGVLKYAGGGK
jgi:leucyl aminopeptidase (aminopeptidase T)